MNSSNTTKVKLKERRLLNMRIPTNKWKDEPLTKEEIEKMRRKREMKEKTKNQSKGLD